jgi:hypothetical protein
MIWRTRQGRSWRRCGGRGVRRTFGTLAAIGFAAVALLPTSSAAQDANIAALTDSIAQDVMSVCDAPSASFAETAAAIGRLDAGYQRVADDFYSNFLARSASRSATAFAPLTRQSWRAEYDSAQVLAEIRSGLGFHPLMAEFALIRVDSARLVGAVHARYGNPQRTGTMPSGMVMESFDVPTPDSVLTRPVVLMYDPSHVGVPRIVCGPPPAREPDYAAIPAPTAARELAEEIWTVCGQRAPALDWFAQVIGLLPSRYRRGSSAQMARFADEALDRERAAAGLTVTEQQLWARHLGDGGLVLNIHAQTQNGRVAFVATFRFGRTFAPAMLAAILEQFGPQDSMAAGGAGDPRIPSIATFGSRSPQEPGTRSIIYVSGDRDDQVVCTMAPTP